MRSSTRDLLTCEVTDWHQRGLIDRALLDTLLLRYASRDRFMTALLKWLGLFAIFQLGLAVFAYIALLSESAGVAAALLAAASASRRVRRSTSAVIARCAASTGAVCASTVTARPAART